MPRYPSVRHPVAFAAATFFAGVAASLLAAGPVTAATPTATVTFTGGNLLGLACSSDPDQTSLSIDSGGVIDVVNETGATATVEINGMAVRQSVGAGKTSALALTDGSSAQLALGVGSWQLTMVPKCLVGGVVPTAQAVTVIVTAAGDPVPAPSSSDPVTAPPIITSTPASGQPVASGAPAAPSAASPAPGERTGGIAARPSASLLARSAGTSTESVPSTDNAAGARIRSGAAGNGESFLPWLLITLGVLLCGALLILLRRRLRSQRHPADRETAEYDSRRNPEGHVPPSDSGN